MARRTTQSNGRRSFGSVRKLPSGRYQARYRGSDGLIYRAPMTYERRSDAADYLASIQTDLVRRSWQAPTVSGETVGEYVQRWIDQHPSLKATTRDSYGRYNRLHIAPTDIGSLRMNDVTSDRVRAWYADLRRDLKAKAEAFAKPSHSKASIRDGAPTAASTYRLLHAAMNTATEDGLFVRNPCRVKGAAAVRVAERPTATPAEVEALAAAMPPCMYGLIQMAAWTGARLGELGALRRCDIDLEEQTLRIAERVYRVNGKLDWDTPKSRASVRTIALPPHLVPILEQHLDQFTGEDPDDLVFTSPKGYPIENANVHQVWARARAAVGREDLRFHDLRHTGQTLAAIAGATEAELMHRMGHSTTSASRIYMHSTAEHGRAVASALSELATGDNVVALRPTTRRQPRTARGA